MAPVKNSFVAASKIILVVLALALSATTLVACQASDEIKQGGEGEYCNGADEDCRSGMECRDYVCRAGEPGPCDRLCDRLNECDASLDGCVNRCQGTTEHWSPEAVDTYESCFTERRTCEELRENSDPPQDCYYDLDLPEERAERCSTFVNAAQTDCSASADGVEELSDQCRIHARTRPEEVWSESTEACVDALDDGVCSDIFACFTDTFDLEETL